MHAVRGGVKVSGRPSPAAFSRILDSKFNVMQYLPQRDETNAMRLNKKAVRNSVTKHTWSDEWNASIRHIGEAYLDKKGDFLVVYSGNKLVAMGGLQRLSEDTAIIKKIRTHPKHRRMGLASMLVQKLEERAREFGYTRLLSGVQDINAPMQELLLRAGFTQVSEHDSDGMHFIMFEKKLGEK